MGSLVGGIVGGLFGGGGGSSQQASKDPWGPAQKPLTNTLNTGSALESYYQQNPFNSIQQTGYQNLLGNLDQFQSTIAPQATDFNNRLMNTNYQRAPAGSELGGAYGTVNAAQFLPPEMRSKIHQTKPMQSGGSLANLIGSMSGSMQSPSNAGSAMSLLQSGQGQQGGLQQTKPLQQGLLGAAQNGLSVVAPGARSYGLIDWTQLNPYTATNGIPKTPAVDPNAKTPEEIAMEEAAQRERDRRTNSGGS